LPSLDQYYRELRAEGLELLLVSFREDPALVARTARERGYTGRVLIDRSGEVAGRGYGVWGPPTVYLIDRQGRLVGHAVGSRDWASPAAGRLFRSLLEPGQ
jgi:peroxiredoxin